MRHFLRHFEEETRRTIAAIKRINLLGKFRISIDISMIAFRVRFGNFNYEQRRYNFMFHAPVASAPSPQILKLKHQEELVEVADRKLFNWHRQMIAQLCTCFDEILHSGLDQMRASFCFAIWNSRPLYDGT